MRVLLADDNANVRWALRTALKEERGLSVIGEAATSQDLLSQTEALQPDLILLEWELPGQAGEILIRGLRSLAVGSRVIVLSSQPGARRAVLTAGADAFVSKADTPEQLLAALRELVNA